MGKSTRQQLTHLLSLTNGKGAKEARVELLALGDGGRGLERIDASARSQTASWPCKDGASRQAAMRSGGGL